MILEDYKIGVHFWMAGREWCCTDVGTRTVAAICIDAKVVAFAETGQAIDCIVHKPGKKEAEGNGWFTGPPYAVAEVVIDEFSMGGCTLDEAGLHEGHHPDRSHLPFYSHTYQQAMREMWYAGMQLSDVLPLNNRGLVAPPVYLLHDKGCTPNGTVKRLQQLFRMGWQHLEFVRLALPHGDPAVTADDSVKFLMAQMLPKGAFLVGVGLGGLVAGKLQELDRDDLFVLAICSPTWADGVRLDKSMERRFAVYSSSDEVVRDRVVDWPSIAAQAFDFDWLTHDTDRHAAELSNLFRALLCGMSKFSQ